MSIVVSPTSPRALLDSALQLSYSLNLMAEGSADQTVCAADCGPGFILHEVEKILVKIRQDLDTPYVEAKQNVPLMMRLREHINHISAVLTGNTVQFATSDTTTLIELIDSLAVLNSSVNCRRERVGCITQ